MKTFLLLLLLALSLLPALARSQCDLRIVYAGPCDKEGNPAIPAVGDTYRVCVRWTVRGVPMHPYDVRFQIANNISDWKDIKPSGNGSVMFGLSGFNMPLDGPIPWRVVLDPDNVTRDVNPANNVAEGVFTPIPPPEAVDYYDPILLRGGEHFEVDWQPGSGTIQKAAIWLGVPKTSTFQKVLSAVSPMGSEIVVTKPNNQELYQISMKDMASDTLVADQTFILQNSAVRVNATLLNRVPWSSYNNLPDNVKCYLQPDKEADSDSPSIAAFVAKSLPSDYRSTLTPYESVRRLFLAVVREITYGKAIGQGADKILEGRKGDCGGFSVLICACLRHIGIPSRIISGWWTGKSAWHVIMEFYMPGCGWVPADGSSAKSADPDGQYAYDFGCIPNLNRFCAISRGSNFQARDLSINFIQPGAFFYSGSAKVAQSVGEAYLDIQKDSASSPR